MPGQPKKWCMAEVLHVSRNPAQDVLASGVLRYLPEHNWEEEIHEVEFLENQAVRRINETTDDDDFHASCNDNPVTKWQPALRQSPNSAPSEDEEWTTEKLHGAHQSVNLTNNPTVNGEALNHEIQSLRTGYSTLVVEVEKIKKELISQSQRISIKGNRGSDTYHCSSAGCVLERLRHKLDLRMQARLRPVSMSTNRLGKQSSALEHIPQLHTGDGVHVGVIKVRVECTLGQFESVARQIKTTANSETVFFSPDFQHTQLPTPSSASFRILFKSLIELTSQIGVDSLSDLLEIARKCGTGLQGDLLRLLGTYQFDTKNASSASKIFIGTSCGRFEDDNCQAERQAGNAQSTRKYPILSRVSRTWNMVDRRFLHPLQLDYSYLPALDEPVSETEVFSLTWKRATDISARIWSKEMTESRTVFGWLELCLPIVQVEGNHLCMEVGALATDAEWEGMFKKA